MNLIPVAEIDFLPADFRVRQLKRRARNWRLSVAAAFLVLTALGLAGNYVQRNRLRAECDRLRPHAAAVGDLERELARIRMEIEQTLLQSHLRSHLKLRPATTRLLAAATTPLPRGIAISEFHIRIDLPVEPASPSSGAQSKQPGLSPQRQDLERILAEANRRRTVLTVRGIAPDDAAVSGYLADLRRVGVFDDVRLLVTDRYDHHGFELRSFAVELRVRAPRITAGDRPSVVVADPPATEGRS